MPGPSASADTAYRFVIDEVTDYAIFLLDAEGRISTWNRGGEQVFGYAPDEIIGRHFSALFLEEDRRNGVPEKELENARRNGRTEDTRWHLRGDNRTFFADGVTTPLRSATGEIIGYSKISRDITDRYMTERRLATQLALTNLLNTREPVETTHYSIIDSEGNVVSNTYTINDSYGAGATIAGLGFLINDEMDDFSAKLGTPNVYGLVGGEANARRLEPRLFRDGEVMVQVVQLAVDA